ncbi:iron export ABC transporter permease subunit FetB [Desulfopila sp. IMCC35006]|uniref:ABC transporter permease n=1 Tax=Desulfopila sp. IMCC35006 TaxID=2569542 RepID=UPI0010ABA325|nr:iron export ABC transporter permease subunit FetB [Desulfopila sp. IMCC35006]TKB25317.1 iron export ABC transporter permease subunit FetB [Desulfopila sp. IMCC35006]
MDVIALTGVDLGLAASLLLLLSVLSVMLSLGLERKIIFFGCRMTAQLLLIGLVLRFLFASGSLLLVLLMSTIMLLAAGREVQARQKRKIIGLSGYLISVCAMFVSSFSVTVLALVVIIQVKPWYTPQYAIPLLGMLLGNTMTGIALALDRMTDQLHGRRGEVEQRLLLGQSWQEASSDIRRDCMRTGMMPIINSMAAAGLVSLPGMMTGQILGGTPPVEAVKYQILIMFLIAAGTGFGVVSAIWMSGLHLFDARHRLRLEILKSDKV